MRLELSKERRKAGLGLAYAALVAVAFAALRVWPRNLALLPVCPWRAMTGFPCPFCQGSHAFAALAYGRFALAWRFNPLVSGVVLALLAWGVVNLCTLLTGRSLTVRLSSAEKKWILPLLGVILLANWVYLILSAGI